MAVTRNILLIVPKECTAANGQRLMPKTYSGSVTRRAFEDKNGKRSYLLVDASLGTPIDVTNLVESGVVKVVGD